MTRKARVPKVVVRRKIEASAEDLFDAWLDAASLATWLRPAGITRTTATIDPRESGRFEIVMHGAGGPIRHVGVYRLIDRPRRLVFTWISPATHQTESLVTVEFRKGRGSTEVVITHEQLPDKDAALSHTEGWSQALALLARERGAAASGPRRPARD